MGIVALLLDNYKKTTGTRSDSAIADEFDVTRQTVSQWRNGSAYPQEETIVALAEGAKQDTGGWLNAIRAERCTGPAALAYRTIARSLGIAAVVCLAVYTAIHGGDIQAHEYLTGIAPIRHCAPLACILTLAALYLRSLQHRGQTAMR